MVLALVPASLTPQPSPPPSKTTKWSKSPKRPLPRRRHRCEYVCMGVCLCLGLYYSSTVWFILIFMASFMAFPFTTPSFLFLFPLLSFLLPGCEVEEHGFLGQPSSEVPVHPSLLSSLLEWQLWTVPTGRQGEGGARETAEGTSWTGQEGARKTTVGNRETWKMRMEDGRRQWLKRLLGRKSICIKRNGR